MLFLIPSNIHQNHVIRVLHEFGEYEMVKVWLKRRNKQVANFLHKLTISHKPTNVTTRATDVLGRLEVVIRHIIHVFHQTPLRVALPR